MNTKKKKTEGKEINRQVSMQKIVENLQNILDNDPDTFHMMGDFITHVNNTYLMRGKYTGSALNTLGIIYSPREIGLGYNMGQATRYIQRYFSEGDVKSFNPTDLTKCMHYLLFEAVRRKKMGDHNHKEVVE